MNTQTRAFPTHAEFGSGDGMSLREYAAIKLRIPDSGTVWLDEMIEKSIRDEIAAKAMQGDMAHDGESSIMDNAADNLEAAMQYYSIAEAMLQASKL